MLASRRLAEQQLFSLNAKSQEALTKLTSELDRTSRCVNEYERFIHVRTAAGSSSIDIHIVVQGFLHEMIRRSIQMNSDLQRAREHQKYRESLSMTLPGYDTAMNTASKILNLTQDDLDEIMSTADDSFQVRHSLA